MIEVIVTFDSNNETWNVMSNNDGCVFYGSAEECDAWLFDQGNKYIEVAEWAV